MLVRGVSHTDAMTDRNLLGGIAFVIGEHK